MTPHAIWHVFKITGVAGTENHLLTLASRIDRKRFRLTYCLLVEPQDNLSSYVADVRRAGVETLCVPIRSDFDPRVVLRLARLFRRHRPSIVHTHMIHADLYGTLAARLAGVPAVVSTKHNDDAFRRARLYRAANRWAARRQDRILCVAEHLVRFAVDTEGLDADKLVVVRHGLDAGAFRSRVTDPQAVRAQLGIRPDAPLAGCVARLDPQKGHRYLLEAWRTVAAEMPGARLLLAGNGPLDAELKRAAGEFGIDRSVVFAGYRDDVPDVMAALDVLALPSLWEGFGIVLLEGMAVGKPVVATTVSAIPEIVVPGETGLLVPPRDAKALSEAVLRLLRDPAAAKRMGQAGRTRLEQQFTVEEMVSRTEAVYAEILGAP